MIFVLNKKDVKIDTHSFYIGRGSPLGNPYDWKNSNHPQVKFKVSSREEAILNYEIYLREAIRNKDPKICDELNRLWKFYRENSLLKLICF